MKRTRSAPGLADEDGNGSLPRIKIGICAMDKKARSKPMRAIIERLLAFGEFEIHTFGDEVIIGQPVADWPTCDVLLSWHSEGFPLSKAQKYAALRKPYLINDMVMQDILLDRRKVYAKLAESGIPVPLHIVIDRDNLPEGQPDPPGFVETEDYVEMNGVKVNKPFVEKPASGEDHNIYIYYPHSMGGGVKRLYRKVENRSGDYDPNDPGTVRRDGSYIIEEFLTTGGTDVKVYTVGPRYAHAEARKSPVVDGKVTRSADGKEVRFPVLLSPQEKEIARMVCLAFGQKVCGFDLLRSERGKSYVCDVNGWSFVKNSHKYYDDVATCLRSIIVEALVPSYARRHPKAVYYDDASGILRSIVLSAIAPHRLNASPSLLPQATIDGILPSPADIRQAMINEGAEYGQSNDEFLDERGQDEELRCVLAIIRHGDRTPKQKMKMKVTQEPILELLRKYMDSKGKQAKLKSPTELQDLLDATRALLAQMEKKETEKKETGGEAEVGKRAETGTAAKDAAAKAGATDDDEVREKFRIVKTVLEQGGSFAGVNRKVQLKPLKWSTAEEGSKEPPRITEAILILKHGGVLTHAGRQQAEALGNVFRMIMYPQYGPAGGGLLRLHSTYRHDLKIYSSDEGRVQTSAAAFTQGLLDLEGTSLTPILVSLVKKDAGMLDAFGKGASEDIRQAKSELYAQMTWDPLSNTSAYAEPQITTPLPSPPPSPKLHPRSESDLHLLGLHGTSPNSPPALPAAPGSMPNLQPLSPAGSAVMGGGSLRTLLSDSGSNQSSRRSTVDREPERPVIHPMPDHPFALLRRLVQHIRVLVEQLRQKCLEERVDKNADAAKGYSALLQAPAEWAIEEGKPCGGERLLLMFDRWRKLLKAFYNEKKKQYDISKVPDIYDSAKYDAIHNSELGLDIKEVYKTAKTLADSVIPNEYGIDPHGKLRIGSKICSSLLGKVLADLQNMREESVATAGMEGYSEPVSPFDSYADVSQLNLRDDLSSRPPRPGVPRLRDPSGLQSIKSGHSLANSSVATEAGSTISETEAASSPGASQAGSLATDVAPEGAENDIADEQETLHRLCPTYAQDVNSPLRHVRTRIYFTSESHVHSLLNVLRFSHLGRDDVEEGLVSDEAHQMLRDATELDYMTHIVFRMYENKKVPVDSPERFRVELLFSPGASHNPYEVIPIKKDHTLPIAPRVPLHKGEGVTFQSLQQLLNCHATPTSASKYTYSMF
ncbi:hypothetical protein WJX72_005206 [[Myrmecia] bisecta]|uniref:Inositol hexakisphosphate and diphosphoinositol-pentakisphosphate kinase n=1 Tax=[Myrmecia] bisecta TaxID=41462 RepID=A0AAW1QQJ5_9CHLO